MLAGTAAGLFIGLGIVYFTPPNINEGRIFEREGKPNVQRLYKNGVDGILVQDQSTNKYVPIAEYLKSIPHKSDRNIEQANIEKVVGWHE